MKNKKITKSTEIEMDMTPMIDVVFNLIIFFMLVTQMVVQEKTELKLPNAQEAREDKIQDPKRIIINIKKEGTVESRGREYNEDQWKTYLYIESRKSLDSGGVFSNRSILIRADEKTPYRYIEKIMNLCVERKITRLSFGAIRKSSK